MGQNRKSPLWLPTIISSSSKLLPTPHLPDIVAFQRGSKIAFLWILEKMKKQEASGRNYIQPFVTFPPGNLNSYQSDSVLKSKDGNCETSQDYLEQTKMLPNATCKMHTGLSFSAYDQHAKRQVTDTSFHKQFPTSSDYQGRASQCVSRRFLPSCRAASVNKTHMQLMLHVR